VNELMAAMLEFRGGPKTVRAAQRMVGPEAPIAMAGGKPRDSEDTEEVVGGG
jgi:hypothetical protein